MNSNDYPHRLHVFRFTLPTGLPVLKGLLVDIIPLKVDIRVNGSIVPSGDYGHVVEDSWMERTAGGTSTTADKVICIIYQVDTNG